MKSYPTRFTRAFAVAALLTSASVATADVTFVGTSGSWGVAANWNPEGVPTATDTVSVGAGQTVVINDGNTYATGLVKLNTGTISVLNGTLSQAVAQSIFGTGVGDSMLYVGAQGTVAITANSLIGNGNGNHAHLTLDGGSYLQNTGWTYVGAGNRAVGQSSTASVLITNGGHYHSGSGGLGIGRDIGNTGYLTVNGGSISGVALTFGDNANLTNSMWATGYGTLSNGTISLSGQLNIGSNGEGHMVVKNASATSSVALTVSGDVRVGGGMGAASTFEAYDGTVLLNRNMLIGDYKKGNLYNGAGIVTISGVDSFSMPYNKVSVANGISPVMTVGVSPYSSAKNNVSSVYIGNTDATIAGGMIVGQYSTLEYTGSYGNWTGVGGGSAVATISGATLSLGISTIGQGGTGSMTIKDSTVTMTGNMNVATTNFIASTAANGVGTNEIIYFDAGQGALDVDNSTVNMGNNRLYVGQSGTGSMTVNNSTMSNFSVFSVGGYLQRAMTVSNSAAANTLSTGATQVVLQDIRQGTGAFTLNSGSVVVNTVSTIEVSVGIGGTGKFTVNGGTFTTPGALNVGRDLALATSISNGAGTLTTTTNSYVGNGTVAVTGGTLNVLAVYLANGVASADYATTEKTSVAAMTVSGGVVNVDQTPDNTNSGKIAVGHNSSYSAATLAIYNGGQINATGTMTVNANGKLIFGLMGNDAAFSDAALLNVDTMVLNTTAEYVVDFNGLNIADDKTITLATYTTAPADAASITFDYLNLDTDKYEIVGGAAQWGETALTIGIHVIPEPAAATTLLGLLGLLAVVRRRR